MNRTLYQLAYRNIKKYKKHYIMVCILIFGISLFYNIFMITQRSYFEVNREYNIQKYGHWYIRGTIEDPVKFDNIASSYAGYHDFLYAYLYNQGETTEGLEVGYANKDFFEICSHQLVQGEFPQQENQILVSQTVFEKQGYHLNQKISLKFDISDLTEYQIVGVIRNSQEGIFPDIYTRIDNQYQDITIFSDRPLAIKDGKEIYSGTQLQMDERDTLSLNPYGFNHDPIMDKYYKSQFNLAILLEGLILVIFVVMALTSISLKKRTHEFALLRGIGMTTKQLMIMNLYEYMVCTVIAAVLGGLCSIGISYYIMRYIETQKQAFHFYLNSLETSLHIVLIIGLILIILMIPIYRSSKKALSGTFDGQQFQYIQIRYHQLRFQNKWRLAWRELKVNKKIFFFLVIILTWHHSLILMNEVIHSYNEGESAETKIKYKQAYVSVPISDDSDLMHIEQLGFTHTMYAKSKDIVPTKYKSMDGYIRVLVTSSLKNIQNLDIQGSLPKDDGEVLINENTVFNRVSAGESIESIQLHLNDELVIDGNKVKIVGIISPLDVQYIEDIPWNLEIFQDYPSVYTLPSLYDLMQSESEKKYVQIFYDSFNHRDEIQQLIYAKSLQLYNGIQDYGETTVWKVIGESIPSELYFNNYILAMSFIVCTLLCYVFNKFEIEMRRNDYSLYQLIGMTKNDIIKKQLCKGVIIFLIVEVLSLIMLGIECIYLQHWYFPIIEFIGLSSIVLVICLVVYGLPLCYVLKNHPLDSMYKGDS